MRTITIRQLSINLFKELEDLPVEVTRYGKPYCMITSTGPISKESQDRTTPKAKLLAKFKDRIPLSKEMEEKLLNPSDEFYGETVGLKEQIAQDKIDNFLMNKHINKQKPGLVKKRGEMEIEDYV